MKIISTLTFFLAFLASQTIYSQAANSEQLKAELVSEVESIKPGQPFWVALHLSLEPKWHTYWKQAGDTGFAVSIDWQLPEGFTVSPINWPIPEKFVFEGLTSFTYDDEVLLLVEITPPPTLDLNKPISLAAHTEWLACKESCIPGSADLNLTLPVKDSTPVFHTTWRAAFEKTRKKLPQNPVNWKIEAYVHKGTFGLLIEPLDKKNQPKLPKSIQFFSYNTDFKLNVPQVLEETPNGYFLSLPLQGDVPDHLEGILVNPKGWLRDGNVRALNIDIKGHSEAPIVATKDSKLSLPKALIFAFLGGVILNLMPCVFPILGLKVMSFVKYAGESRWKARKHGVVFAFGVLVSFWVLAGLLLILRAGGDQLGWGFQLQSPFFITGLCFLLFLLALNFLGVFEMGLSLMSIGNKLQNHSGYTGTFASGVLATVLATPCTGPFMGTTLGFALTQPASFSLSIFTALALGMAAPYVILTFSPTLLKFLPRPGPWMETFKQAMAFPLLATVIWLLWVFGHQTHHNALTGLLFGLLLASVAAWVYGRFAKFGASRKKKHSAQIISILFLATGIILAYTYASVDPEIPHTAGQEPHNTGGLIWEKYSPGHLEQLKAEGRPILIDFTAAWCLTCQVNKKNTFSSEKVIQMLKDKDVVLLHADYTKRDAEITKALQSYGRSGVPTNVFYPGKKNAEPIVLPELLTPGDVLNILK